MKRLSTRLPSCAGTPDSVDIWPNTSKLFYTTPRWYFLDNKLESKLPLLSLHGLRFFAKIGRDFLWKGHTKTHDSNTLGLSLWQFEMAAEEAQSRELMKFAKKKEGKHCWASHNLLWRADPLGGAPSGQCCKLKQGDGAVPEGEEIKNQEKKWAQKHIGLNHRVQLRVPQNHTLLKNCCMLISLCLLI